MAEDATRRTLMFALSYVLLKRRRDVNNANALRSREIQRRVAHRQHFRQRHQRMMMMLLTQCSRSSSELCPRPPRIWSCIESTDWWERVAMREFQPSDWLEKFRMSRETFFYLCEELRPRLSRQDTRLRPALRLEKRVAVALWRLASNVEYRTISTLFGIGRSTVCKCVREVCQAIVLILRPLLLPWPSPEMQTRLAQLSLSHWRVPHCLGALGSLHVPILAPPRGSQHHRNSRGWLSVAAQAVVDAEGRFWEVWAGFPGGYGHSAILQSSRLWQAGEGGALQCQPAAKLLERALPSRLILGDGGCPLRPWLLRPYSPSVSLEQRAFDQRAQWAVGTAERAMLRLRARWQCLLKRNDCRLDLLPSMILACCLLHNLCEVRGDGFQPCWQHTVSLEESPQPLDQAPASEDHPGGEEVRALLAEYLLQVEEEEEL
ncbi:hypothetical protein DNTS_012304 [Danionella cerebrum]|uniref:Uncharacterized protein n=1 Tax=Danionella cerebrum TaxID=2873325 RepID=A0A553REQ3_9TELE|nr:hypothetical protein DNTS_012304 [Danionella translucida]